MEGASGAGRAPLFRADDPTPFLTPRCFEAGSKEGAGEEGPYSASERASSGSMIGMPSRIG